MKKLLRDIYKLYETNDEFKRQLENYGRYIELPEGRFVKDVFMVVRGSLTVTLLSPQYTKLDPTEKDVMQRTFYNINQMLDFLLSPVKKANEKKGALQDLATKRNRGGKKGR
jgi:hypothetical protein